EALDLTTGAATALRAGSLTDLVRVAVASADPGLAERLMSGMDELPLPRFKHALVSARATLAEAGGRMEGALDLYAESAERWSAYGHVVENAHAPFGEGRCLVRLGFSPDAQVALHQTR